VLEIWPLPLVFASSLVLSAGQGAVTLLSDFPVSFLTKATEISRAQPAGLSGL